MLQIRVNLYLCHRGCFNLLFLYKFQLDYADIITSLGVWFQCLSVALHPCLFQIVSLHKAAFYACVVACAFDVRVTGKCVKVTPLKPQCGFRLTCFEETRHVKMQPEEGCVLISLLAPKSQQSTIVLPDRSLTPSH